MSLIAAAVALATAAAPETFYLQALTPTSGGNAAFVLDGRPGTSWSPSIDGRDEGILFRFEKSVEVDAIAFGGCNGDRPQLVPVFNGAQGKTEVKMEGATGAFIVPPAVARSLRSVFLRVERNGCISEVVFKRGSQKLDVRPPRSVPGRISTSSVLKPKDAYHPAYLFDGRLDFGWVEGVDGPGIGESVTITFDQPVTVNAVELWNGYQRSKDHFQKNARAKRISFGAGDKVVTLDVADAMGPQKLALPAPATGTSFTLKILDAVKGSVYQDLVLSELRFWDNSGPFTVATTDLAQREEALRKALENTSLGDTIGKVQSAACLVGQTRRDLKLRTNNTFVLYEDNDDPGGQSTFDVFDGVWVLHKKGSPWSELELFGRRHRVESTWAPYNETTEVTTDRISGGKIEIARVSDLGLERFQALVKEWESKIPDRVTCLSAKPEERFGNLSAKGAIVIRGTVITDIMLPKQ
jgi:hypothetical protein